MTGIIAAMDKELALLSANIEASETKLVSGIKFISGRLRGKRVVAAVCGIGKVNAAVCTQSMILGYAPEHIINTGVAGALSDELKLFDVVVAGDVVQHDVDTTALGDPPGFVSTVNMLRFPTDAALNEKLLYAMRRLNVNGVNGTVATGDRFVSEDADKRRIRSLFGALACEMEGGSIAQVCYMNKTPCAILRAISDGANEGANMSYTAFADRAAQISANVLLEYLSAD